jgi:glycosyltransferase involved in cell wall biosynthesis
MSPRKPSRFVVLTDDADAVLERLGREGKAPRRDFVEFARLLGAEVLSLSDVRRAPRTSVTHLIARTAGEPAALAWLAARRGGTSYLTLSEDVGLPLAALLRARPSTSLVIISHRLAAPSKQALIRTLGLFASIGVLLCLNREQERIALEELRCPREKLRCVPFQVDDQFFSPDPEGAPPTGGVVSVGRELRDYPTLFAAVEGTGIPVTVVASSPWSKREDQTRNRQIPANVTLRKGLTMEELRDLYRRASLVVVPVEDVDYPAGVTSLFEAQATAKPVVVTASKGLVDSVEPGTARLVPCGDVGAMREAIQSLLAHPEEAAEMGRRGREAVARDKSLDLYAARVERAVRDAEAACSKGSRGGLFARLASLGHRADH